MFCKQCGKELTDGTMFCKYCGAAQAAAGTQTGETAGNVSHMPNQKQSTQKSSKRSKGGIIAAFVVVLLVIAVGTGTVLYFTSDGYHIKKNLKLAEECFAEREYKEALSYYRTALKLDSSLVEAYLGSADVYIEDFKYQDAADILEKGLDKVRGKKKEILKEKLKDTYSLWVTALISVEDYDGARAVLDEATVLSVSALAEERQRVNRAESGVALEMAAETGGFAGTEDSPLAEGSSEAGTATDSVESFGTEDSPVSEVMPESSESVPEQPEQPKFILPESDSRYLTMEELAGLTAEECRIARNELFARHGRLFKDEELQAYFDSCDWYYGWVMPEDFDETVFNAYEVANRDLIIKFEKEQGYR